MAGCGGMRKKAMGGKIKMKEGGSFPDLNKDGKVTQADILMGRGVGDEKKKMAYGGKVKKMKEGGKVKKYSKDGCAMRGKTKGKIVGATSTKKMARGGMTKMARGGMTKMARGGMTKKKMV